MKDLIPKDLPDGESALREGIELGRTVELGKTAWCREKNVRCDGDYKQWCARNGQITWQMVMGLSSVDEQVEALRYLYDSSRKTGVIIDRCHVIADRRMGLPQELWDKAPRGTSFMLEGLDDYIRIAQAAPIQPVFGDHHIGSPAAVRNTINALRAGAGYVGTVCHYYYNYPYWKDDVAQIVATVKALGIMASKSGDGIIAQSAMADALPSQFTDHASIVGYARLEKYVVEELCGANYSAGYGNLTRNIPAKIATWLALYDVLKADHNVVSYLNGNTIDASENLSSNYAVVTSEVIACINAELRYKTGVTFLVIPATEAIRVPTKEEIAEVHQVARVAQAKAKDYEKLLDFFYVNQLRALLVQRGTQFFESIKRGLPEYGVDIKDPVQVLLAVRRLGAAKLEEFFHPGEKDVSLPRGIRPFVPTDLLQRSIELKDEVIKKVYAAGLADAVSGKKFVAGSTDTHEFGLYVVAGILGELGAQVVNGGVDMDAEDVLNLAYQSETPYIVLSTHNGLCLDYAKQLMDLVRRRNQQVKVLMGGRLNSMVEGSTEPVDVSRELAELGVIPCKNIIDMIKEIACAKI